MRTHQTVRRLVPRGSRTVTIIWRWASGCAWWGCRRRVGPPTSPRSSSRRRRGRLSVGNPDARRHSAPALEHLPPRGGTVPAHAFGKEPLDDVATGRPEGGVGPSPAGHDHAGADLSRDRRLRELAPAHDPVATTTKPASTPSALPPTRLLAPGRWRLGLTRPAGGTRPRSGHLDHDVGSAGGDHHVGDGAATRRSPIPRCAGLRLVPGSAATLAVRGLLQRHVHRPGRR